MKFLWRILSIVAVANLLALLAFVGWLKISDRLDQGRVREVRELFTKTGAQRKAEAAEAQAKAEADEKLAAERGRAGTVPVTASETLDLKIQLSELDQARLEAMRREVSILQDTLRRERKVLDADRAAFAKERDDFGKARQVVAQTEGSAQFKKALATYEGLKPDKAKLALKQLIDTKPAPGVAGGGIDQAVAYLNAMQERSRTKIIDEFLKDDPKVANDLLERLRTRGMLARAPESAPG
jgi:hypothetical protein